MHDALFASSGVSKRRSACVHFSCARAGNSRVNSYLKDTKLVLSVSKNAMALHLNETQSRKMRELWRGVERIKRGLLCIANGKESECDDDDKAIYGSVQVYSFRSWLEHWAPALSSLFILLSNSMTYLIAYPHYRGNWDSNTDDVCWLFAPLMLNLIWGYCLNLSKRTNKLLIAKVSNLVAHTFSLKENNYVSSRFMQQAQYLSSNI